AEGPEGGLPCNLHPVAVCAGYRRTDGPWLRGSGARSGAGFYDPRRAGQSVAVLRDRHHDEERVPAVRILSDRRLCIPDDGAVEGRVAVVDEVGARAPDGSPDCPGAVDQGASAGA